MTNTNDKLIEAMGQAICNTMMGHNDALAGDFDRQIAQAALDAIEAAGFGVLDKSTHVSVPVEANWEMLAAFNEAYHNAPVCRDMGRSKLQAGLKAMLAAAQDKEEE